MNAAPMSSNRGKRPMKPTAAMRRPKGGGSVFQARARVNLRGNSFRHLTWIRPFSV